MLNRLCGHKRPGNIRSLYNNMMFIFKTDPLVVKRGFKINLRARRRQGKYKCINNEAVISCKKVQKACCYKWCYILEM